MTTIEWVSAPVDEYQASPLRAAWTTRAFTLLSGVGLKIYGTVGFLAAIAVMTAWLGVSGLQSHHDRIDALIVAAQRAILGEQLDRLVAAVEMDARGIQLARDRSETEKIAPLLLAHLEQLSDATATWSATMPDADHTATESVVHGIEEFIRVRRELVRLAREAGPTEARAFGEKAAVRSARTDITAALAALVRQDSSAIPGIARNLEGDFHERRHWLISLCAVGVSVGVVIALLIFRRAIARPLSAMARALDDVARGNFDVTLSTTARGDEIGALSRAVAGFARMAQVERDNARTHADDSAASEQSRRKALLDMCDFLEADLDSAVAEVLDFSRRAVQRGAHAADEARAISSEVGVVASSSEQASSNVHMITDAAGELAAKGREIARRATETADSAIRAVQEVDQAGVTIAALNSAAERIGIVVKLISEVAAQTSLLALNATIEAARAGEAGRGFAVVATEVKALARKTSDAAADITERVDEICAATHQSVAVITKIGGAVREINTISTGVVAVAEEQKATLQDVTHSLAAAARDVSTVATGVAAISERAASVETQSRAVAEAVSRTDARVDDLRTNLIVSLRESSVGNRRSSEPRIPVSLVAELTLDTITLPGRVLDISRQGLLFRPAAPSSAVTARRRVGITIKDIGRLPATVVAATKAGIHAQLQDPPPDIRHRLEAMILAVERDDRRLIDAAQRAARQITDAFTAALVQGEITESNLFATDYRAIPGTDPQQYEVGFVRVCDRILPAIQEPALEIDPRIVFCAAVDRNGYLPTHNRKFSLPQRPDDPEWNAANSRNRRIFNDRAGLAAARVTRDYLMQTYDRAMGGGNIITLKEIDIPITVRERHWGALRLAFRAA